MTAHPEFEPRSGEGDRSNGKSVWALAFCALGVVYGDIGTSPLYAMQEAAKELGGGGGPIPESGLLGAASLIVWTLTIIVTLKYVFLMLNADNRGEGGILTLATLARKDGPNRMRPILWLGLIGAALFYGDACVTPAISIMASVGGLATVYPKAMPFTVPVSFAIIFILFVTEKKGSQIMGNLFGPVMTVWVLTMAALAIPYLIRDPGIFRTLSPVYGLSYVAGHGFKSLGVIAMCFLSVTGAEALYADLGHFGRAPIKYTWLFFVYPCLILNYLAQASLLLHTPAAIANPFVFLAPHWAKWPVVGLSMMATIIASQAVISGAYSLTSQAFELGLVPRLKIIRTSQEEKGQIYMPQVNRALMIATLLVVLIFRSSDAAASAYGIAVSGTMFVTSLLAYVVFRSEWGWSKWKAGLIIAPFIMVEAVFVVANLTKIASGGEVPLLFTALIGVSMYVWMRGSRYLRVACRRMSLPLCRLADAVPDGKSGPMAVYMTGDPDYLPARLLKHLQDNGASQQSVIVSVIIEHVPTIPEDKGLIFESLRPGVMLARIHLGYEDEADIPKRLAKLPEFAADNAHYIVLRNILTLRRRQYLRKWEARLFKMLKRAATPSGDFFRLPPRKILEITQEVPI